MSNVFQVIEQLAQRGPVAKSGPLKVWEYNGKFYASGLFGMHDQEGFSLTDSLIECRKRGWIPCIDDFRACAIMAGWTRERADMVIAAAKADSGSLG